MKATMGLSYLKLQKSFFSILNKGALWRRVSVPVILCLIVLFSFTPDVTSAFAASDDEIVFSVLVTKTTLKKGDDLDVRIFVENNSNSDIQVEKIIMFSEGNPEISADVIINAFSSFEQEYVVKDVTSDMTNVAFILYFHFVGEKTKHIKFDISDIEVQNKINIDWILYLVTWFFGVLSAVFSSETARRLADARTKKQYEKDQANIALHKALSFFSWAEKVALNPTIKTDAFWEKIFMEGDTLLYLQKASVKDNDKDLTDLSAGVINLLLLMQRLGERLNEQDIHSPITKNLQGEIDASAKALRELVINLLSENG